MAQRSVLFYRNFTGMTGGHLKVKDYFDHFGSSDLYEPRIYVTPQSHPDHLWPTESLSSRYEPESADVIFIAGLDWLALAPWKGIEEHKPVVNLIQHVRHAEVGDPRYQFLTNRATRICVSEEVAEAVRRTGKSNGPIYTVPCATDLNVTSVSAEERQTTDVFIAGTKRRDIARRLARILQRRTLRVDCITEQIERSAFIERMARARVVVTLPSPTEGFYLPALEAMKLGKALVCPDAIGNRGFCIDRVTALIPQPSPKALANAVSELLGNPALERELISAAARIASAYTIERERRAFLEIMDAIE